ncbi:DUF2075 domain-containing protein [Microbulbifer pacificus]|uniref:DUF2075 domain-containing protein n=1 Tax=Microbulbifer pacificus TaxID=407164 RepID=A0AAU0N1D7_9GAMM|nr:DUF2075 domain-containing protein [Microbulbifer pacificus]WOX06849.1 DUF2075 domain-containing protein [Microbulbifer pacificus]
MERWYFDCTLADLQNQSSETILGHLAAKHDFALDHLQRESWINEIKHLRETLTSISKGHLFFEYTIPRMGRRADIVLVVGATIFVIEYKVGATKFNTADQRQTIGYALDLECFHEGTHDRRVVPVLLATAAREQRSQLPDFGSGVCEIICTNGLLLRKAVLAASNIHDSPIDPMVWAKARYKPTPTIIEAAMSLYAGHNVADISRSDAGAVNLTTTAKAVSAIIENAKQTDEKSIVFVSGVPGSGKTLAGLNIATARARQHEEDHAVFLSGNGPLVEVLRESLARDQVDRAKTGGESITKEQAIRRASSFIQNVHHFRDEALRDMDAAPIERVAVFDEAQRAWDQEKTTKFMRERRRANHWEMSEPEFLISAMDRHEGWCVIVCLIGNGQEIHTGEAGITEWFAALKNRFPHWQAYVPQSQDLQASEIHYINQNVNTKSRPGLHLSTCIRSFRSEAVAAWVNAVLSADAESAQAVLEKPSEYPIYVSRDLQACREWLREKARGTDRVGLVASSNALRLKPHGIHVKAGISVKNWFLDWEDDVRSSQALEDVATEFAVQGLELDWSGVCWDANLRFTHGAWETHKFSGSKWMAIKKEADQRYLVNAYRVLLTRARKGMIIFVPEGDTADLTRLAAYYDQTYEYLLTCGVLPLAEHSEAARNFLPNTPPNKIPLPSITA